MKRCSFFDLHSVGKTNSEAVLRFVVKSLAYLLLCGIPVQAIQVCAQELGTIKGSITDNNTPVPSANVVVYAAQGGKFVKGVITNTAGVFTISNLVFGRYILKVRRLGYKEYQAECTLNDATPTVNLKTIILQSDTKILDGVEVTANKEVVIKTAQGFVMNADAAITQQGGTATDILRNMPTVAVDAEGAVTIRGKAPLILINGRNSSVVNLDNIPASSIESLEIINNPTAQYDADSEAGIINIRLKKGDLDNLNIAAALGGGWGAKGRVNSSVLANYKTNDWNIGLAYDNRFAGRIRIVNGDRVNTDSPDEYSLTQHRSDNRLELNQNLRLTFDYTLSTRDVFSVEILGALNGQDNDETLLNTFRNQQNVFQSQTSRRSVEILRGAVIEGVVSYAKKFDKNNQQLTFSLSSSLNDERENTDITNQSLTAVGENLGLPFLQRTHNYQNTTVTNFKVDYTHPVTENAHIETGYKGIVRLLTNDFLTADNINNTYIPRASLTTMFSFQEQIHAVYALYSMNVGEKTASHWNINAGVRGEYAWNEGSSQDKSISFFRPYWNIFPSLNCTYYVNRSEFWKLSYSYRINRPSLGQLNPFIDITDSLNQASGNPNLLPELVHSVEAGYSRDWEAASVSASVFYRYATNAIRRYTVLLDNNVALSRPTNFGNAITYGVESIASLYPTKFWTANASFSLFKQTIDGNSLQEGLGNSVLTWYAKIVNTLTIWENASLQVIGNYNAPTAIPQGTRVAIYNVDAGFQQKIFEGKGRIGLIVTDIFNTQSNGYVLAGDNFSYSRIAKVDTRAVQLTFAFTFGATFKEKLMENQFNNE